MARLRNGRALCSYDDESNERRVVCLWVTEDARELLPNTYRYPFAFKLPESLPTSFEGVHGSVRYYVRASLNRRYMLDAVFKRGFTVNNVLDLNSNPQAPVSMPTCFLFAANCLMKAILFKRFNKTRNIPIK